MRTVVAGRDTKLALLSGLGYVSIGAIVIVAIACGAVALLRGKARLAIGAAIIIGGADVTTQVLKHSFLDRPDFGLGVLNSLPSGHTTVVASAVGAALLVAPGGVRPLVAAAGGFATTLTGASTIVAGWHRPADVVAALAVSLVWTGDRRAVHPRSPPPGDRYVRQRAAGLWRRTGVPRRDRGASGVRLGRLHPGVARARRGHRRDGPVRRAQQQPSHPGGVSAARERPSAP